MYEVIYLVLNLSVLPAWALLIIFPNARLTQQVVHSCFYPLVLGVFYLVCLTLGMGFGHSAPGTSGASIGGITALFSHPNGVLTGWSHYLVFDLFVGAWIGRDRVGRGIAHWMAAPTQLLSFLFGPVGLLVYLIVRFVTGKGRWSLEPADEAPQRD